MMPRQKGSIIVEKCKNLEAVTTMVSSESPMPGIKVRVGCD